MMWSMFTSGPATHRTQSEGRLEAVCYPEPKEERFCISYRAHPPNFGPDYRKSATPKGRPVYTQTSNSSSTKSLSAKTSMFTEAQYIVYRARRDALVKYQAPVPEKDRPCAGNQWMKDNADLRALWWPSPNLTHGDLGVRSKTQSTVEDTPDRQASPGEQT